jgi:D-alanine-D-alanine ligase
MRVAVLLGGMSREREVSLKTGRAVLNALGTLGYEGIPIDPGRGVASELIEAAADVVFIALHGRYGEDGCIQGLLEILDLPYTGSGVLASSAAMDKIFTKRLFRSAGLPTPDFAALDVGSLDGPLAAPNFGPPWVVKPSREGSSIGMSFVDTRDDLETAVRTALAHDPSVLLEKLVRGKEITVGVIGNAHPTPLPPIEIRPKSGRYDYASKYTPGATEYIIPAQIPENVISDCQALGLAAHRALGCRGVSRVDMIVGDEGIDLLEVNTIPGMTETSLLPKSARAAGIEFPQLVDRMIRWALEAHS